MKRNPIFIALPKSNDVKSIKSSFPISCMHLFAYLQKHNIESDIIDFSIYDFQNRLDIPTEIINAIKKRIYESPPLFIGFNCFSTRDFPLICTVAKSLKSIFPHLKICIGGMHPSHFAKEILQHCAYIDYIVVGEGEEQAVKLTKYLRGEELPLPTIQAFAYRDAAGRIIVNPRNNFMLNLDTSLLPAWKLLDIARYHVNTSNWNNPKGLDFHVAIPVITTRSCPFSCSFCSVAGFMGKKLRFRSPDLVLDEIEYLHKILGQNYFEFLDDNINVNKKHALAIFKGILKRRLNIHFSLTNGIHLASADNELLDIMAEAGLAMIKFPIEHGNDFIRNIVIGKNLSKEKIISLSNHIKRYDVFTFGLFIMGFPEDTPATLDDTLSLMRQLELDINIVSELTPFPGTKIYEQCLKDELLLDTIIYGNLYNGNTVFDVTSKNFFIKPYKMTLEELHDYRSKFDTMYFNSDRAKRLNEVLN